MPEITPTELKMRGLALRHVAQRGWPTSERDLNSLVRSLQAGVPRLRPSDVPARSGKVPSDVYGRAMAAAAAHAAALNAPEGPCAAPGPSPAGIGPSGPQIGAQGRDYDPEALTVLALVVQGFTNQAIAERLGVGLNRVKFRIRVWLEAAGVDSRRDLADWARATGLLDTDGAAR